MRRERRAVTTVEVSRHERQASRSTGKAGNTGKELISDVKSGKRQSRVENNVREHKWSQT
jgi:hypothetical protein